MHACWVPCGRVGFSMITIPDGMFSWGEKSRTAGEGENKSEEGFVFAWGRRESNYGRAILGQNITQREK